MTNAEAKVKELSEKLLDNIDCNRNTGVSPECTLAKLECYLSGVCDGIDLSEEMRRCEHEVVAAVNEKIDQHAAKMGTRHEPHA